MRTVTNENGEVKNFETDEQFLEYAKQVYKKNEKTNILLFGESSIHWLPENIQQATEYIHEHCGDLELTEY